MAYKVEYRQRWGSPSLYRVHDALCADGVRRSATITGEPDTFFSVPARVQVKGKTVAGSLTGCHDSCPREASDGLQAGELVFSANAYGKNGHLLPGIARLAHNGW